MAVGAMKTPRVWGLSVWFVWFVCLLHVGEWGWTPHFGTLEDGQFWANDLTSPKKIAKKRVAQNSKGFFLAWMAPERCLKTLANSFCRNSITKQMQSSMCWTSIQKSLETLRHVFLWSLLQLLLIYEAIHIPMEFDCCRFTGSKAGIPRTATPVGFSIFYERETAVVIFKLVCQGSNRPSNRCKTCENSTSASLFPQVTQYILSCRSPCPVTIGIGECFWSMRWLSFSPRTTQFRAGLSEHKRERTEKKWAGENRAKF